MNEKWYNESIKKNEWQNFENFEIRFQNYEKIKQGISLYNPFKQVEDTCFVYYEPAYYTEGIYIKGERNEIIENYLKILLKKALSIKNVIFNPKKIYEIKFKKDYEVFCFIDKYCSNTFLTYLSNKIEKTNDNIKLIKLEWLFDCIEYGMVHHISNYEMKYDKKSEEIFLKKKWFLQKLFPIEPENESQSYDLDKNFIEIGRKGCKINLPSPKLSKNIGYLEICQDKWRLIEDEKNRNGIFYFKGDSYKRVRGCILKEGDVISFGGGKNIPYGNCVINLKRKVVTFEICSEENDKDKINHFNKREKEIENELAKIKEINEGLKERLRRRDKNIKEIFPRNWGKKKVIVIVDTNIFIKYGEKTFHNLKNHGILIPRIVFNEIDKLKDSNRKQGIDSFSLRKISKYLMEGGDKNVYIPSVDVTLYILGDAKCNNDEEIVMNANHYQKIFKKKNVVVLSDDNNLRIRCSTSNIEALTPKELYEKYK